MDNWLSQLYEVLQSNAHGVIESDVLDFTETDDPALAASTAICDKIIARGNPTLVDPNWERLLLSGQGSEFLQFSTLDEVDFLFEKSLLPPGSSFKLLDASEKMLEVNRNGRWPRRIQKVDSALVSHCAGDSGPDEMRIYRAAWHLLLRPLAVQRCMRGLLLLYRYGALDSTRHQRILAFEEDMPAVGDAFEMLWALWKLTSSLNPELGVGPPDLKLEVIGQKGLHEAGQTVHYVDQPTGTYDAVITHSFFLTDGHSGSLLDKIGKEYSACAIQLRRELGPRSETCLQWSKVFHYKLEDGNNTQEESLKKLLQFVFRKKSFRDGQLRSIVRLLRGGPAIVLLPTGGGKSLIYQFAGMLLPGMTVIVDPIISLMEDQVRSLKSMGIDRITEISSLTLDRREALRRISDGESAYAFLAPERMQSQEFRDGLLNAKSHVPITLVVLDEAHCLSEWGHDFRPAYLRLPHNLKAHCAEEATGTLPTIVALTGTASYAVLKDMQAELEISDDDAIIRPDSFDRKELNFDVRKVSPGDRAPVLAEIRGNMPMMWQLDSDEFLKWREREKRDCGLVFCPHVNADLGVVRVAEGLGHTDYYAGDAPRNFSGNWNKYKQEMQREFTKSEIRELVTTKSFGMGIDKDNIRYTIHYVMPASIEQFYQEAGRAGRNQIEDYAICTVIYSHSEWDKAQEILKESNHAEAMQKLNSVPWSERGDMFFQLFFLLNSYKGREHDIKGAFELWHDWLFRESSHGIRKVQIPFGRDREKCLYRLATLGLVEDYTLDWRAHKFEVVVSDSCIETVSEKLAEYLTRYRDEDRTQDPLKGMDSGQPKSVVLRALRVLIDFIYDEVVDKRKEAIKNMAELCWRYQNSDSFRREILDYLEESPFTKELSSWLGQSLAKIGLARIRSVLPSQNETTEGGETGRLSNLMGTTRRMLEADPNNVALRYLSVIARSMRMQESDLSVIDESNAMLATLRRESGSGQLDVEETQLELLQDIHLRRPHLAGIVANTIITGDDGLQFARRLLGVRRKYGRRKYGDSVRVAALGAVSSNIAEKISDIGRFYDLNQPGEQDDTRGK